MAEDVLCCAERGVNEHHLSIIDAPGVPCVLERCVRVRVWCVVCVSGRDGYTAHVANRTETMPLA